MEELIRELNSSVNQSSSERVQEIQRRIQQFQREKSGWQKGFDLLGSDEQILRFYGALTLTIKTNTDWDNDGLTEDESAKQALLRGLLNAYALLVSLPDASFVLLKLCSTITAYFVKDKTWHLCIRHVSVSLLHGQYMPPESIGSASMLMQSLLSVNFDQMRGILWFASTLVEDVSRLDTGSSHSASLIERLANNSKDVWLIMKFCLDSMKVTSNHAPKARLLEAEAIETAKIVLPMILPWLEHLPPDTEDQEVTGRSAVNLAHDCVSSIFACFSRGELQDLTIQTLTGVVESRYQIFRHTGMDAVASITTSKQAALWVDEMQQGEFSPEAVRYVEFLIALIKSEDLSSPAYLDDKVTLANLLTLKKLMHCEGIAMIEDEVCQLVLECLNEVVEQYNEWTEQVRANTDMRSFITEVCLAAVSKAQYPMAEVDASTETWDTDDRTRFQDFRNDVTDFLASAFRTLGSTLIEALAGQAVSNGGDFSWPAFEASLFCLLEFSDTVDSDPEQYDPTIHAIMNSAHWAAATQSNGNSPSRVRQTIIRFVAEETRYLRRNRQFLIPCLDFLFRSLQVSGSAQAASRAIQSLCYSQRKVLVEALPQFMSSLPDLNLLEPLVKHKIYSAVAAIIQALPTEKRKLEPLNSLLNSVSSVARQIPPGEPNTESMAILVDLLQALAAVGRGLRAPSDVIIDLETSESVSEEDAFWTSGSGYQFQREALSLCTYALNISRAAPSGEIVEAACEFVKSGYTEEDPSPFKFSTATSIDFLTSQIYIDSPNIDAVMGCASAFLASAGKTLPSYLFVKLMDRVLSCSQTLIAQYSSTGGLPTGDFPASSLDFMTHLLPKCSSLLFSLPSVQTDLLSVFDLAIITMSASDTLPRRSAASFFAAVFELVGHNTSLTPQESSHLSTILNTYTTPIVAITLKLIGGECARSEIEAVTEVLRKLVSKQTSGTRRLLKDAMNEQAAVLSPKAYASTSTQQRLRFIAQVEALRGTRRTTEVARDFWIACRGDAFGYVT